MTEIYLNLNYKNKIPDSTHPFRVRRAGDNIYKPSSGGAFVQLSNHDHDCGDMEHDLSGKFVLTSTEFFYFGAEALSIPEEIRPEIPTGQSAHGSRTHNEVLARQFVEYIKANFRLGVQAAPHKWHAGDVSWKQT